MVISKIEGPHQDALIFGNECVERVEKYVYLNTFINDDWDYYKEIRARIESSFYKLKKMFFSSN